MTSLRWPHLVAIATPLLLVGLGAAAQWYRPDQPIALGLLLFATLTTKLTQQPRLTWLVAALATLSVAVAHLNPPSLPDPFHIAWFACLWVSAGLLYWPGSAQTLPVAEWTSALAQAPSGVIVTDLEGQVITANQSAARLFNRAVDETQGEPLHTLSNNTLWQIITEQREELARGAALDIEFEVELDHRVRTHYAHSKLARDNSGAPRYYVLQLSDAPPGAEALRPNPSLASEQLRRLLTYSSDVVIVVNHKLAITFVNESANTLLGSLGSELHGQPVYQHIKPTHRKTFMNALEGFVDPSRREVAAGAIALAGPVEIAMDVRVIRLADNQRSGYALLCKPLDTRLNPVEQEKQSQARFSQVFHSSPDAILILRAEDGLIIDFNEGFTRLLGYRREDAIGEAGMEALFWNNPTERDIVADRMRRDREITDYETTLKSAEGRLVHVEISLRYLEIDGELCVLCIGRDITKRISAEAALVETEEKFEKVFTQSPDGIVIIRQADNTITDLNDAFASRSGYSREELIGHPFTAFSAVHDVDELTNATNDLLGEGMFTNRAITFVTKSGEEVPSLISATVLELSGEPFLMVIAKDISKQRATEERLRRSEQRFRGIFENAPIGIMLVDMQGRVFQANHTAAELLTYDEQALHGIHISRLVASEDRNQLKESLAQLAGGSETTHRSERRMLCENGLELWTNFHVVLQKSGAGKALYYIVQIADITDIKRGQQRMEQLAFYDTLTDLANRRLFQDRLVQTIDRCVRNNRSAALLYLDLDNFKRVNDTLGHQTGDHLLREVATRLNQCVRKEDTVGRTGGDEFTIVLSEIATPSDAGLVAQKILNHLRRPIEVDGHPLVVTTSIGITVMPGDGEDPSALMANADLAMYKAKERGRNNYQFYSDDLNTNAVHRLRTEYEIRTALSNDEFVLFYQPKVSLKTRQIVGVESLIRWQHPERGLLGPDEFIEIAEDTGSIIDIGSWVIEEACRACQTLTSQHGRPIHVAVNLSPRQFRDPNLVTTVRRCLRELNLSADSLEIEITETMLMQDVAAAQATVKRLSDLGVRLAIDDFGTGYSSLNYLKRFPINTVKVDKSFVADLPGNADDLAITRAVIAMAHQLNMEVVAEGVETREQLEFLAQERCEYAQGYLFSKALPLPDIARLINNDISIIHGA